MTTIYTRSQLENVIRSAEVIPAIEEGFVAYSNGKAVIPPVGQLLFENPPGDCHIKYGNITGDSTFTIKIATGFSRNADKGLPTSNGVILVFSSETGALLTILQDEGFLTDIRTAAAGAIAAKLLAPRNVDCIGIIGAGIQARLQLEYLKEVVSTRKAMVWARSRKQAETYQVPGFEVQIAESIAELASRCRLIVTTTPSHHWLLGIAHVQPGTHITAVGADGGGKQELQAELVAHAQIRAVDSRKQCAAFGDSSYALKAGLIRLEDLVELGQIAQDKSLQRQNDSQITIADLTGVAIQDIQVAKIALQLLSGPAESVNELGRPAVFRTLGGTG